MIKLKLLLIMLILLVTNTPVFSDDISGFVHDAQSGESIIGVNVFINETGQGAATNLEGFYIVRNVPARTINLTFSHIAYEDTTYSIYL